MSLPGQKRCPFSIDRDSPQARLRTVAPQAARAHPGAAFTSTRRRVPRRATRPPVGPDHVLDLSGFMRSIRLVVDHHIDCVRITALPRDATIEFPALPDRRIDAREIDFGHAPDALAQRNAPLPALAIAKACTNDGGTTFVINALGRSHALRVVLAAGAAPRVQQRLADLLHRAQRAQRRLHTCLRLLRCGLAPVYWIDAMAPLAAQLWRALPASLRHRVCSYFAAQADSNVLHPGIDFGAALAAATPRYLALLLEVLASALEYWLDCARFEQVPARYWDQQISGQRASGLTNGAFLATCQEILQRHCAAAPGTAVSPGIEHASERLAALLADPQVSDMQLRAGANGIICIPALSRDVTFKLLDVDSRIEFSEFGSGWASVHMGVRSRSLSIHLRDAGYRLPRHLLSALRRDVHGAVYASLTDMSAGGGLSLVLPAAVAFDDGHWNALKADADFRLEMSLSNLLEWSEVLSQARRLAPEQDLRLSDHMHEMGAGADHWSTSLANALVRDMHPALASRALGLRPSILLLQQLQVAQLKLHLSGGLLRALAQDEWCERISRHRELGSIVGCITAVHVDCAWETMGAQRHYKALCGHLHALERSERDPVRQHVLCRDRELLEALLPIMEGELGHCMPPHASDLATCAGDPQRRLKLKIILVGLLDARLFCASDQWRGVLLRRLRHEAAQPCRTLEMNDLALIAFLRHADADQLRLRMRAQPGT